MGAIELNGVKIEENRKAFTWGRIASHDPATLEQMLGDGAGKVADTLDAMIDRRRSFLVDYQDNNLADRYVGLVQRVREAEAGLDAGSRLTNATARAWFRLLAYKDEYEVARLHADPAFLEKLQADFGRKSKLRFHLAPPLLSGKRDARGRPLKREFGAWILPVFRMLARLRRLRGTPFDVFGYTAERRMERQLIVEFEETIDRILAALDSGTLDGAVEVVEAFLDIRGFGPVKEEAVAVAREHIAELLSNLEHLEREAA